MDSRVTWFLGHLINDTISLDLWLIPTRFGQFRVLTLSMSLFLMTNCFYCSRPATQLSVETDWRMIEILVRKWQSKEGVDVESKVCSWWTNVPMGSLPSPLCSTNEIVEEIQNCRLLGQNEAKTWNHNGAIWSWGPFKPCLCVSLKASLIRIAIAAVKSHFSWLFYLQKA